MRIDFTNEMEPGCQQNSFHIKTCLLLSYIYAVRVRFPTISQVNIQILFIMDNNNQSNTLAWKLANDYAEEYLRKLKTDFVNQVGEELLKSIIIDVYTNAIQNTLNEADKVIGCSFSSSLWTHFYK